MRVRMGLHTGEPAANEDRYVGLGVHRAARIGAVANGGQVLLSSPTRELVEDEVGGVTVRDLGAYRLKDFDRPERLYQLDIEGLQTDFPPVRAEKVAAPRPGRRRVILGAALAAVVAVAVVLPLLVLTGGGSEGSAAAAPLGANAVAAVDSASSAISGSATLQAAPTAIAYGQGSIWVAISGQDSVSRIDPSTTTVRQTIPVGNGPSAVAVGGGFVWVANSLDGTVSQIDPQTNGGQVVNKISVGNGPTGVAYGLGAVWVANSFDRSVQRLDPLTDKPGKPIAVDAGADAIAVGNGAVWVTAKAAGVLSRLDPRSGEVTPINVGNDPAAVAVGTGAVWVANSADANVWRIDPGTNRVLGTITVGEGPSGVATTPGGKVVWVSNALSGTLSKVDPALGKVVGSIDVGDQPEGVAIAAGSAYVAVKGSGGGAHRGGTLTLAVAGTPKDQDGGPLRLAVDPVFGGPEWELLSLTNDGLVGYARAGGTEGLRVVPDLAAELPTVSDGGLTYTFHLRPGIHYSTGAPVRPADVRRGIERALADSGGFEPDSYLSGIVGGRNCVKAPKRCDLSKGILIDPASNTLTFRLTSTDPDFLYKLALPAYDALPAGTPLDAHLPLPATGPYEIASVDDKRHIVRLTRNPSFHVWSAVAQPDGFPDQIVEKFGYTGASAVRAVEQGTADITSNGYTEVWSPALMTALRTRYSSRLYATPTMSGASVWLNTKLRPFDDVRVRRALSYAIDRNHLIELAGGPDVAQVGCQMLPPNVDGYRPYCPFTVAPNAAGTYTGPDLTKARRLVAASGTHGQPVTVWFYDIPIGRRNGSYLVSVLRSLGYKARLRLVPSQSQNDWRPNRQAGVGGFSANFPSANDALSGYMCRSDENLTQLCNRRIDREFERARRLQITDAAGASRLWTKIDREITDLAPQIVLRGSIAADFVSRRTGDYTSCWVSFWNGATGACLDQLWVR